MAPAKFGQVQSQGSRFGVVGQRGALQAMVECKAKARRWPVAGPRDTLEILVECKAEAQWAQTGFRGPELWLMHDQR